MPPPAKSPEARAQPEARLRLLHMVSTSLMQGTDTRAIAYQALVDLSQVVPDAARLTYWSLSSANEFVAQCSMSTAALHSIEGMRIPLEVNPDWLASLRAGETILVTDAESDARVGAFADMFRKAGTRALAVTPIARAGELLGGISVAASEPLPWSADTVATLHALADVLAIGILRDRGEAEREAAAQALRQSEMRLRVVNAVTTSIAQGNPSASVAQMAIAAMLNVIPDVRATWWLDCERRQHPMYSASTNQTPALTDPVPLDWFEDAKTDDVQVDAAAAHTELCLGIGAKSLLLARMNKGRETFGWISIDASAIRTWSAYEVGLVQEVAAALALGISKERAERDRVTAEQALRESEQRFRDLASLSTDWYWEQDEEFRYTMLSGSVTGSTDEALSAYLGKRRWEIPIVRLTPEQWAEHRRTLEQHLPFQDLMLPYSREDGTTGYNCVSGMPLFDENGKFKGYRGVVREVTQARRAEEELLRFRAAMETSGECIFLVDRQTLKYIDVNRTACDVLGYSRAQLLRMGPLDVEAGSGLDTIVDRYDDVFAENQPAGVLVPHTMELLCADGSSMPVDVSLKAVHIGGREIVVAVCRDSRERLRYETQLERQANYDTLTGLSNRNLLRDQLGVAMEDAQGRGQRLALCFVDLDNFKLVNDSLGHNAGDRLLQHVATSMRQCLRGADIVARYGGDEFVLILTEQDSQQTLERTIRRVLEAIARPIEINGQEIFCTCSVGVSLYPDHGTDYETLMRNADIAMYEAKAQGRNSVRVFRPELDLPVQRRLSMAGRLRRALERDEFALVYQPRVTIGEGRIVGCEALIRWNSPEGPISPRDFIPVAEESGVIAPIGEWVIATACAQNKKWLEAGLPEIAVSVNVSAAQFRKNELVSAVSRLLGAAKLPPRCLEIELTESLVMESAQTFIATLHALKEIGVQLSVDDFGTGYSSLAYLKRFPVDALKIDQSFVRDIQDDGDDAAIVDLVINLAHGLGLRAVAEGVELPQQLAFLRQHRCDEAQGYLFSKPVAAAELERMLGSGQALALPDRRTA